MMKKALAALLLLCTLLALAGCGAKGGGSPGGTQTGASPAQHYEGYGVAVHCPAGFSLYSFAEKDAALDFSVLLINDDESIFMRAWVDALGELHTVLSPSEDPAADGCFEAFRQTAAVSAAFPPMPDLENDDEALAYIEVLQQLRAAPEAPLPLYTGELPGLVSAPPAQMVTLSDDGSLSAACDPESGLYGYIDRTGAWVIDPQFTSANRFSEGLAMVCPAGGKDYKFIDRTGAIVIEGAREENDSLLGLVAGAYTEPFREGLTAVHVDNGHPQDQFYIDRQGNIVIDATYIPKMPDTSYGNEYCLDIATPFRNGFAAVARSRNTGSNDFNGVYESSYIIDTTGHVVATVPDHLCVDTDGFDENMLIGVTDAPSYISGDAVGLCDTAGNLVVPCVYQRLDICENGFYRAMKDGMYGYIDAAGNTVLDFVYESATPFAYGVAGVEQNGMWGCIDGTGNYVIEPAYDGVSHLDERIGEGYYGAAAACGVVAVKRGDYWAIFSVGGFPLTDFCFHEAGGEDACPFKRATHDVLCYCDEDGLWGLVTPEGFIACAPRFSSISGFYDAG